MEMTSKFLFIILFIFLAVPILCVAAELWMAKKHPKAALFFPLIMMCLFFWTGYYVLILGAILYAAYFIVQSFYKKKGAASQGQNEELDKMNIHDL